MEITIDTLSNLNAHVLGAPTLVYFYSDMCAPCVSLRPKVRELVAAKFPRLDLVMINAMKQPGLSAGYQVFTFPVLIIFFEGKEFRRFSKYISLAELESVIGRLYSLYFDETQDNGGHEGPANDEDLKG